MSHRIARLFEPLLQLLFPGTGRRRRTATVPAGACACPTCSCAEERPALPARPVGPPLLRAEDNAMVRPYLVAHERQEEARRQRARRRALWFAVHGIDIGPRVIHGVEVTA
ncbi:hypothetical protein ACFYWX_35205 [Streptomyces sp. NPDC002888]|uniref:hypothetical protein n=1 Tax=Streptomyces sp. NPDC002888 TaxID=3364668 RepID=UPI0036A89D88